MAIGGRFEVVRRLKTGRGIETFLATDRAGGGLAVVKTVRAAALSPGARERLENLVQRLQQTRSPFLARPLAVGGEEEFVYLARPFVEGETLEAAIARGPLPLPAALMVGRCILGALQEAHEHGLLQRSLSTGSIILEWGAPEPRARLVAFGLSRSSWLDPAAARDQPPPAALYASPEQSGLLGQGVDEAADLYSLGVILYESLRGENPFRAPALGEVLRRHLMLQPPTLRSRGVAVPPAVDELLARLLRKDPRERPPSAREALQDLLEIAAGLSPEPMPSARSAGDRRRTLADPAFVGREEVLATLEESLARTVAGEGSIALIEAESGGGKTRLLDELARRSLRRGALVLRGQSIELGAALPFQFLAGVVAGLSSACRARPELLQRLRRQLGGDVDAVCTLFPELAPVLGDGVALSPPAEELGELRAGSAVSALLAALGSPGEPAVVLLDDLQWAAGPGARALDELLRRPFPHVLVAGAFRSEEAPADHWLRRLPAQQRLVLPPLGPLGIRRMAESMAGPLPEEALAAVVRLGGGNPFFASAVLRGLVETRALVGGRDGWEIDDRAMRDVQASREAGALLARRVDQLPAETAALLGAGALLGKRFELELAARLSGLGWPAVLRAVEEGRRRHLLWLSTDDGWCSLVHDRIRDELLSRLDEAERRRLHGLAAQIFRERPGDQAFPLAYHFGAAGQPGAALPYALAAAVQARARCDFETALRYYRIAEAGAAGADTGTRLLIAEALGHLLGIRGAFDEAVVQLEGACALARDTPHEARVERLLGEVHFRRGAQADASRVLESALRRLGKWVPSSRAGYLAGLAFQVAVLLVRKLPLRRRAAPENAERQRLSAELSRGLCFSYLMERGTVPVLWAQLRDLNVAERHGPPAALAQAWAEHAYVMALVPWTRRSIAYARRACALSRSLGDAHQDARLRHCLAAVLCWAGEYAEAIEIERATFPVLERLGDATWANFSRGRLAIALRLSGSLREAAAIGAAHDRARLDTQSLSFSIEAWSAAAGGRIPARVIEDARARCSGPQERVALARAEGMRLLAEGRPADAAQEFAAAEGIVREVRLRGNYAGNSAAWLTTALRLTLEQLPALATARRAALLRRARAASRRSLRVARTFPESLPHALRERGYLDALGGRLRRARAAFDESLAVATARGMRAEHAQTRWARGQVGLVAGWAGAAEEAREGGAALHALGGEPLEARPRAGGEPVTFSLVDRYEQVLGAGHAIASASSVEAIHAAVVKASLNLLRAERCEVVPVAQPLARRAVEARRPLIEDAPEEVRSAICAPIFVHGKPACALYATTRQLQGQFGPDDERLAGFIANLASAALENAAHQAARDSAEREVRDLTESALREQEEERRRLALALHDGAGQVLAAITLHLGLLGKAMPDRALAARVDGVMALTRSVIEDLRGLSHDLRPAALDRQGLLAALRELARSTSLPGLSIEVVIEPPELPPPSPDVAIGLFRIAQAAVANLVAHGQARRATIFVRQLPGSLLLEIVDDGKGFDPASARPGGIGLIGMRERATWLGGAFRVESAPGQGTRVSVELPRGPGAASRVHPAGQ